MGDQGSDFRCAIRLESNDTHRNPIESCRSEKMDQVRGRAARASVEIRQSFFGLSSFSFWQQRKRQRRR